MQRRRGLTMVELLVVIAIIGILASLLLPAILNARSGGRQARCAANLKQLAQAVQTFHDRHDRLPPYWGTMEGGGGAVFGGWLLHLLPSLDQQAAYDRVLPQGSLAKLTGTTTITQDWVPTTVSVPTGNKIPAIPAVNYQPEQITTGTAKDAAGNNYIYPIVIPASGYPGEPERDEYVVTVTGSTLVSSTTYAVANWARLSTEHDDVTAGLSLPFLLDTEDDGLMRTPSGTTAYANSPLTNYQANAHVLTKFSGARYVLATSGTNFLPPNWASPGFTTSDPKREWSGYFPQPFLVRPDGSINGTWSHLMSGSSGPVGRKFSHIADGQSNTLLFAEGMRQCDAGMNYRYAFFPSGPGDAASNTWFNEHAFGILPSLRQVITNVDNVVVSGTARASIETYGHTLMFQTQPRMLECNPTRMQSLHGNFLMTAMCDGSTRKISSLVSRREPVGSSACGRARFGSNRGDFQTRGGQEPRKDGVWDMLIVPNDPPENILSNTGEIGRERGPDDPPL